LLTACSQEPAKHFVEAQLAPDGNIVLTSGDRGQIGALYQVGSIAKLACTLAALELQRRGELSLNSFVNDLVPEYRGLTATDSA